MLGACNVCSEASANNACLHMHTVACQYCVLHCVCLKRVGYSAGFIRCRQCCLYCNSSDGVSDRGHGMLLQLPVWQQLLTIIITDRAGKLCRLGRRVCMQQDSAIRARTPSLALLLYRAAADCCSSGSSAELPALCWLCACLPAVCAGTVALQS